MEVQELKEAFDRIDKDKDGKVSLEEYIGQCYGPIHSYIFRDYVDSVISGK